jgi:uncharacterized cupin superfamily protein
MNKVNLRDIPELEQRSPTGKYHSFGRNVSLALGGLRNTGVWGGGHPFDFQMRRIPAGAAVCPHHAHLAQWELFLIRRGAGMIRVGAEQHPVRAGDCFIHPPGEAHQLVNSGPDEMEVLIIADNPQMDAFYYPDSDKWGLRPPGLFFRLASVDYFDGEDTVVGAPGPVPPLAPPLTPFARRKVNLDDLPWEDWRSPSGKFAQSNRGISLALGSVGRAPLTQGGHPFDLEQASLPPGTTACPYHFHALQWELYFFTAGSGEFRLGDERFAVGPGDAVLAPPGAAHTFTNTGPDPLAYFLVADDPPADYWHYPDSGKWGFSSPRKIFRPTEADYFDGEE